MTKIEWTDATWNPVTGCSKVSGGCRNCYAERMARRLKAMEQERYRNGFGVTLQSDLIGLPLRWRKPRTVFVCSMSDLFHDAVPDSYIHRVFATMAKAGRHTFQVLTKRSGRLVRMAESLPWPRNVWAGVSVESADFQWRIRNLIRVPAAVRFISVEPLLESMGQVPLIGIDWVIVGGESGPGARRMKPEWVVSIRDQCRSAGVPFFFKQWGGTNKKKAGRLLEGQTWDELPTWSDATDPGPW